MRQILVVDDDLLTRTTLTILLEEAGYQVQTVNDGLDALEFLKTQLPDLLISDIRLPRLTGIQLLAQLRSAERTRHLPVLLTSASVRPNLADLHDCLFLEKPIGIDLLLRTIASLLSTRTRERAIGDPSPLRPSV
jgi:CheY-like chemotaxis protein